MLFIFGICVHCEIYNREVGTKLLLSLNMQPKRVTKHIRKLSMFCAALFFNFVKIDTISKVKIGDKI